MTDASQSPKELILDALRKHPIRPPSDMDRSQYRSFMDGRRQAMSSLCTSIAGQAEGLLLPVRNGGHWGISKDARPDGLEWRITRFDKDMTPLGHEAYLTPEQAIEDAILWVDLGRLQRDVVTSSEEFRQWFRSSRVVDDNGRPRVAYHGTGNGEVEFMKGSWAFFSSNPTVAGSYTVGRVFVERNMAGRAIYPVYLRIENPLVVDGTNQYFAQISANLEGFDAAYSTDSLAKLARDTGHDGLIVRNIVDPGPGARTYPRSNKRRDDLTGDVLVVFDASQIRSVFSCNRIDQTEIEEETEDSTATREWATS